MKNNRVVIITLVVLLVCQGIVSLQSQWHLRQANQRTAAAIEAGESLIAAIAQKDALLTEAGYELKRASFNLDRSTALLAACQTHTREWQKVARQLGDANTLRLSTEGR